MFSRLKLTKLVALFAAVISLFCTLQTPALAAVPIDMPCFDRAYRTELPASDPDGAIWYNSCGERMEIVVDYANGLWNYGSAEPYNTLVGPKGNPNGPVYDNFANPTCNGAELSYLINGEPIPYGCYSIQRSFFVEEGEFVQLVNNDAKGSAYQDNEGAIVIKYIRNLRAW
ncbi:hypothetical protein BJP36_26995 [Moorena producens JHB]|uniref:Uncharacterized protein n=1 Tax=Moorena producens (strain JHB) TaxID=1454205 RepID=A0A1D9G5U0_MOOP1|nr:hypothetical protein [Moorena producens]AOY83019.1 hypothetical protein BJP36_26995 [Moorena producens JHB]